MEGTIEDKLKQREDIERLILKDYESMLDQVFQVIYEVDADIVWERIYRFSVESNFVMVSGKASVPTGTTLPNGQILTTPLDIGASFTLPWCMLDDDSSAYELAEAARDIFLAAQILGTNFVNAMRNSEFTYEALRVNIIGGIAGEAEPEPMPIVDEVAPEVDQGIDMDEVTQVQMRKVLLEDDDG